jgi:hypothetical protein
MLQVGRYHLPVPSLRKSGAISASPHKFSLRCVQLIKHRDNFSFITLNGLWIIVIVIDQCLRQRFPSEQLSRPSLSAAVQMQMTTKISS